MRAVLSPVENALSVGAEVSLQSTTPRMSESLADSGANVTQAYIPTTPRDLGPPLESIPSAASPGLSSTWGKSYASSQSSIMAATPLTSVFSFFVLSAAKHTEGAGAVECLDRSRTSVGKEVTEDHSIRPLNELGGHHRREEASLKRQCIALRLAPISPPAVDPRADTPLPLVESISRTRPRFSRKPSRRPVIVTDDEDSIRSPMTAAARDETAVSRGMLSPLPSAFPGLDISVEDGQSFPVGVESGSKGLRRVHGCANLKSLWLQVGLGSARQEGMSVTSVCSPAETDAIRSAICCPSPMPESVISAGGDRLMP